MQVAGTMFAVAVLGFKGAVSSDVLWGVAFPTETRGRNAMVVIQFGHL